MSLKYELVSWWPSCSQVEFDNVILPLVKRIMVMYVLLYLDYPDNHGCSRPSGGQKLQIGGRPTLLGTSDRGTARLASTLLLSRMCCSTESAASTLAAFMYVMNPNPLDRRDTASFMTMASATGPNRSKYRFRASSVVSKERPPMKILLWPFRSRHR